MLSAAELTSCRNYARLDSGAWKLMYLLPFGDGYLSSAITMKIEYMDGTPPSEQKLFSRCRIPRRGRAVECGCDDAAIYQGVQYGFSYKKVRVETTVKYGPSELLGGRQC